MSAKIKAQNKLLNKKLKLLDLSGAEQPLLNYYQAMELVKLTRKNRSYRLANNYLEQIADQINTIPDPLAYLVDCYLEETLFDEAEKKIDELKKRFPVASIAFRARARFHQVSGDIDGALRVMTQAVQIYPRSSKSWEILATLYHSIGDTNAAVDCYDRALQLDPDFCGAMFGKARLLGDKSSENFIAQIQAAIDSNKFVDSKLAFLLFAVAFIYEKSDVESHFEYLNRANAVMAKVRPYNTAAERARVTNTLNHFRQPVIEQLKGLVSSDFKPIFIIGMPRSGTTLLEQIIGAHPKCKPIGESNAFHNAVIAADQLGCPPMDASSPKAVELCRQYFLRIAENIQKNRLILAASNKRPVCKSLGNHLVAGLIGLALPGARIINIERHPLATIYSCYQQYFASGASSSFSLESLAEYYQGYTTLMQHWKTLFPDRILTLYYEDLVSDKQIEIEKILNFCNLEWDPACLEHEKFVKLILTSSDDQARKPIYQSSLERWKKVAHHLEPARRKLGNLANYRS